MSICYWHSRNWCSLYQLSICPVFYWSSHVVNCASSASPTALSHCVEMIQLGASHAYLSMGLTLLKWVFGSKIFAFWALLRYWLVIILSGDIYLWMGFVIGLCDHITLNSLFSLRLFNMAFLSLCASMLLVHANSFSQVTELCHWVMVVYV